MTSVYNRILDHKKVGKKMLSILVDPDKFTKEHWENNLSLIQNYPPDFFFVGGSFCFKENLDMVVEFLKENFETTPVVIFPGDYQQVTPKAEAILFLSLISGRNPEFLIGQQLKAAPKIYQLSIESIPTGYILIDGGRVTSVQYISDTTPIPADKPDLVLATSLAGQLLGNKLIYLEAGSGALNPVSVETISLVSEKLEIPLIVGGGIRSKEALQLAYDSGADMVVIGTLFEESFSTYKGFFE